MDSSGLQWTPLDSTGLQSTPVGIYSDKSRSGLQVDCPVQWTPLHSTPLHSTPLTYSLSRLGSGESPLESTGVQWSPVESIWNTGGTVKTSHCAEMAEMAISN